MADVEVQGFAQFQKALRGFVERRENAIGDIEKRRKVWRATVISFMIADVDDHFQKGEGSKGKWKKWSKSYRDAIAGKVAFRFSKKTGKTFAFNPAESSFKVKPPRIKGNILIDSSFLRN